MSRLVIGLAFPRPGISTLSRLVICWVMPATVQSPPFWAPPRPGPSLRRAASSSSVAAGHRPGRPSAMSSLVRALSTERGRSSGSQPGTAASSFLCISNHWSSSLARLARAHEHEAAAELAPDEHELELAAVDRLRRRRLVRVLRIGLPPAVVPQHDVALAVAARDDPLEPAVGVRVILDLDGERLARRVEARPLGDRPADEHAVDLEAQVVVQTAGPVALDEEAVAAVGAPRHLARRLGRLREVAHRVVLGEPALASGHDCESTHARRYSTVAASHTRHADGVLRVELAQLGDEADQLAHHQVGGAAHRLGRRVVDVADEGTARRSGRRPGRRRAVAAGGS